MVWSFKLLFKKLSLCLSFTTMRRRESTLKSKNFLIFFNVTCLTPWSCVLVHVWLKFKMICLNVLSNSWPYQTTNLVSSSTLAVDLVFRENALMSKATIGLALTFPFLCWVSLRIQRLGPQHSFLLFTDIAKEREVEGDLVHGDMGDGMPFRAGSFDGAISISALQWLCNADKSHHKPAKRLASFFASLYACLVSLSNQCFKFLAVIDIIIPVKGFQSYFPILPWKSITNWADYFTSHEIWLHWWTGGGLSQQYQGQEILSGADDGWITAFAQGLGHRVHDASQ